MSPRWRRGRQAPHGRSAPSCGRRRGSKALGCIEFQRVVDAQHIGRADLGHHIVRSAPRSCPAVPGLRPAPPWFRRSRLSKTRGSLPIFPACAEILLLQSQHAGWPVAGAKLDKSNNFNHSAPLQACIPARSGMPKTVAQFAAAHLSSRIANQACFRRKTAFCRVNNVSVSPMCAGEASVPPGVDALAIKPEEKSSKFGPARRACVACARRVRCRRHRSAPRT